MSSSLEPTLEAILRKAVSAFAEQGTLPKEVFLAPGAEVAHDNCCDGGGELYLRVVEIYPTGRPFPARDNGASVCGAALIAVTLAIGTVRCAHTVDEYGTPPSAEQMTNDELQLLDDMAILHDVLARLSGEGVVPKVSVSSWKPQGPRGGCVSGEWVFTVGILGMCHVNDHEVTP